MAGDWIKLQHVTPDKPEIYRIAAELGVTPEDAFGRCCRVWIWADQQSLNGHALSVTNVTLDSVARRDGFATALLASGWLVSNHDGTISFPNFTRHNGETAKNRALAAERKAKQRAENHGGAVTDVTKKSRASRDKSVTREEKSSKPPTSLLTDVSKEGSPKAGKKIVFKTWLEAVKANGEKPITTYEPVWEHAKAVGLDRDWIGIAWSRFCDRYLNDPQYAGKRYIDWRRTFLNAIEGNWFNLWRSGDDGNFVLTTVGRQADLATREAA